MLKYSFLVSKFSDNKTKRRKVKQQQMKFSVNFVFKNVHNSFSRSRTWSSTLEEESGFGGHLWCVAFVHYSFLYISFFQISIKFGFDFVMMLSWNHKWRWTSGCPSRDRWVSLYPYKQTQVKIPWIQVNFEWTVQNNTAIEMWFWEYLR